MAEDEETLHEIYLHPGELRLVKKPAILHTLLGSCVGIAFRVPRLGLGALCHPMMPHFPAKRAPALTRSAARRYVDYAIRELAGRFDALGARRDEVEVKAFGGGDVLLMQDKSSRPSVGQQNREAALKVLESEGFALRASSLGGCVGVKIDFNTLTGEVILRRLGGNQKCHSRRCDPRQHPNCPGRHGKSIKGVRG